MWYHTAWTIWDKVPAPSKPDSGQTKSYLIETMVELLGSQVVAGRGELALTATLIAKLLCGRPSGNNL
jgi:hypothetical protein